MARGWSASSTTADIPMMTLVLITCYGNFFKSATTSSGSHNAPPAEYNLLLTPRDDWTVAFGDNITYQCEAGMFFETQEVDPTLTELIVPCMENIGEYVSQLPYFIFGEGLVSSDIS